MTRPSSWLPLGPPRRLPLSPGAGTEPGRGSSVISKAGHAAMVAELTSHEGWERVHAPLRDRDSYSRE